MLCLSCNVHYLIPPPFNSPTPCPPSPPPPPPLPRPFLPPPPSSHSPPSPSPPLPPPRRPPASPSPAFCIMSLYTTHLHHPLLTSLPSTHPPQPPHLLFSVQQADLSHASGGSSSSALAAVARRLGSCIRLAQRKPTHSGGHMPRQTDTALCEGWATECH